MNGADLLCDTLLAHGIDVCFANPGTSEMHFVAALDRKPQMRCVLGLFEGVVTAAADGYARMAEKPAATLLHLGPGLANGLANLHNARRGYTPIVNIVGDHPDYHLPYDAVLTSDIASLAKPMSAWVGRCKGPNDVPDAAAAAYRAAVTRRGVATLMLPADAAWSEAGPAGDLSPKPLPAPAHPGETAMAQALEALKSGKRCGILMTDDALRADALENAGKIAAKTGARLFSQVFNSRIERGAGRVPVTKIPYPVDMALACLKDFDHMILVGATAPVAFFAYPGKPSALLPDACSVVELAKIGDDLKAALAMLCEAAGAAGETPVVPEAGEGMPQRPSGKLTAASVCALVARHIPEHGIVVDESITGGATFDAASRGAPPHDYLQLTGGAIGTGIPLAAGAAIGAPGRKVIGLQADGSGFYTVQGLWTQAREKLDVVTVILSNRSYAILQIEMANVGVNSFGKNASRMLNLDDPDADWVALAKGFGVDAARAETATELDDLLAGAMQRPGPFLIEAMI